MWVWPVVFHLMALLTFSSYAFYGVEIQGGFFTYILIYCILVINFFRDKKIPISFRVSVLDIFISLYIFWNLSTLINVLAIDKSVIVYIKGISYSLFPIIGYFLFSNQNNLNSIVIIDKFFKSVVILTLVGILTGIYFYFLAPEFYFRYVLKLYSGLISNRQELFTARLVSYFGDSAVIGNISAISIPLILYLRKQMKSNKHSTIIYVFSLVVAYTGVILSFSRSAWVGTAIITIFYILSGLRRHFLKTGAIIAVFLALVWISVSLKITQNNIYFEELQKRVNRISESFADRFYQIEYAMELIDGNPMGVGLGQAGHKSFSGDEHAGVFDNNYLRIFVETGFVGIILFLSIMFFSILLIFKYIFYYKSKNQLVVTVGCILFIFYFQALGSNILDLHYSSFLFWSFLGILSLQTKAMKSRDTLIWNKNELAGCSQKD
jgi:hypothetical protein